MTDRDHYQFSEFKKWDTELHEAATKFKGTFGKYPNIMLANDKTYHAIEASAMAVAPQNLYGPKSDKEESKPFSEIGGIDAFSTKDYYIEFCNDKNIPFTGFALVYDAKAQFQDARKSFGVLRVWTVR